MIIFNSLNIILTGWMDGLTKHDIIIKQVISQNKYHMNIKIILHTSAPKGKGF